MLLNQEFLRQEARISHMDSAYEQAQVLNENNTIYFAQKTYDIFLSHSYLDHELVYTIVDLFNAAGYSVYVDWMIDSQLDRTKVDRQTSETLRKRMNLSKGLAYVSTSNIATSKWCPWELGYVDGQKCGRCAILPVMKTKQDEFKGQEYLSLYPYIDYNQVSNSAKMEFWVNDPQDKEKYISLRKWLDGQEPHKHV